MTNEANRGTPDSQWMILAKNFPPTLVTDMPAEKLKDGQTPDAFGIGIDKPGYLYASDTPATGIAQPELTTVSTPTNAPTTPTHWYYFLNRLWGMSLSSNQVWYGAPGYSTRYILQGMGSFTCDFDLADSTSITRIIPFGNSLGIFKQDYLYYVPNAGDAGGDYIPIFVAKNLSIMSSSALAKTCSMEGTLYWASSKGIFAFNGQNISELTYPIRNSLGTFEQADVDAPLYIDPSKNRIMGVSGGVTKFIIELAGEKLNLHDYSTSGFRWTSPTLMADLVQPLVVDKIAFAYYNAGVGIPAITYQVKINDTWQDEETMYVDTTADNSRTEFPLTARLACRRWAIRITSLPSSFYISQVQIKASQKGITAYSGT